jgi:hypothetical protein
MSLSVTIEGDRAKLMRGNAQIGELVLDGYAQVDEVIIAPAATPTEAELIIRLAASHVAQYVVERFIVHAGVLREKIPPLTRYDLERSHELLSFAAIAPEQAPLSAEQLVSVMNQVGIGVRR